MNEPIGTLIVETEDETAEIPYYHDPRMGCGCTVCKLANKEISLEFFKGYHLGSYISELCKNKNADDRWVKLFFTDDEIADFIMNS